MRYVIILILMVLLMPLAHAGLCQEVISESGIKEGYKVPKFIPYGNEVMNVYGPDKEALGHIVTEKHKVKSFGCSLTNNPTYNVYIKDENVVEEIIDSDNRLKELNKNLGKDIKIKGKNIMKNVKTGFSKIIMNVMSWFS
ncbi:MAG: hypothetical protein ACQER9_01445 [Nanobdellota archaeon]